MDHQAVPRKKWRRLSLFCVALTLLGTGVAVGGLASGVLQPSVRYQSSVVDNQNRQAHQYVAIPATTRSSNSFSSDDDSRFGQSVAPAGAYAPTPKTTVVPMQVAADRANAAVQRNIQSPSNIGADRGGAFSGSLAVPSGDGKNRGMVQPGPFGTVPVPASDHLQHQQERLRLQQKIQNTPANQRAPEDLAEFKKALEVEFDERLAKQFDQLEVILRAAEEADAVLKERKAQRDKIIDRHYRSLLGERDSLDWEYNPLSPMLPPGAAQSQYGYPNPVTTRNPNPVPTFDPYGGAPSPAVPGTAPQSWQRSGPGPGSRPPQTFERNPASSARTPTPDRATSSMVAIPRPPMSFGPEEQLTDEASPASRISPQESTSIQTRVGVEGGGKMQDATLSPAAPFFDALAEPEQPDAEAEINPDSPVDADLPVASDEEETN
ncbi:hypothetical protein FF011L_42260 [Roseimaritima multifibrata]|uniref:Uncharacterized protein n=1 Tax=Roseimaritima multifibrata TaxID=1930274 RepID=A0A517MKR6_9BACT|nr:hypothetical protein [Roseimaritima multifibrata]QDS95430.1 hypothetical protein FF011L_42260 [Roseimaritima multifibrata]